MKMKDALRRSLSLSTGHKSNSVGASLLYLDIRDSYQATLKKLTKRRRFSHIPVLEVENRGYEFVDFPGRFVPQSPLIERQQLDLLTLVELRGACTELKRRQVEERTKDIDFYMAKLKSRRMRDQSMDQNPTRCCQQAAQDPEAKPTLSTASDSDTEKSAKPIEKHDSGVSMGPRGRAPKLRITIPENRSQVEKIQKSPLITISDKSRRRYSLPILSKMVPQTKQQRRSSAQNSVKKANPHENSKPSAPDVNPQIHKHFSGAMAAIVEVNMSIPEKSTSSKRFSSILQTERVPLQGIKQQNRSTFCPQENGDRASDLYRLATDFNLKIEDGLSNPTNEKQVTQGLARCLSGANYNRELLSGPESPLQEVIPEKFLSTEWEPNRQRDLSIQRSSLRRTASSIRLIPNETSHGPLSSNPLTKFDLSPKTWAARERRQNQSSAAPHIVAETTTVAAPAHRTGHKENQKDSFSWRLRWPKFNNRDPDKAGISYFGRVIPAP